MWLWRNLFLWGLMGWPCDEQAQVRWQPGRQLQSDPSRAGWESRKGTLCRAAQHNWMHCTSGLEASSGSGRVKEKKDNFTGVLLLVKKRGWVEEAGKKKELRWRVTLPQESVVLILFWCLPVSMTTAALTGRAYGAALPGGRNNVWTSTLRSWANKRRRQETDRERQ